MKVSMREMNVPTRVRRLRERRAQAIIAMGRRT
jgi:hypothetical protein